MGTGKKVDMRNYWIVDCISGYHDDEPVYHSIAEARAERDRLNTKRKAEGGSDEFWIIVDTKGNTVV